jgi:hypothetical protein
MCVATQHAVHVRFLLEEIAMSTLTSVPAIHAVMDNVFNLDTAALLLRMVSWYMVATRASATKGTLVESASTILYWNTWLIATFIWMGTATLMLMNVEVILVRMVLLVWNLLVCLAFHRTPTAASAHLGLQTDGAITRLFKNIALYALFKIVGPHLEGTVA